MTHTGTEALLFRGEAESAASFKTPGFYKYVRHPITLGFLVFVLGAAVCAQERPEATASKAELIAFEQRVEAAVLEADVVFLGHVCAEDFTYTHGDGWTSGAAPLSVDTKTAWLASLPGRYTRRDVETQHVEIHGDVGLTMGLVHARIGAAASGRSFAFWCVRVYERRDGQWRYLSHRTVRGPVFEE